MQKNDIQALARVESALSELAAALRLALTPPERPSPPPDQLLSVEEAAGSLGIGRSEAFNLIASGRLRSLKLGRRRLIPASAIGDLIAELEARR